MRALGPSLSGALFCLESSGFAPVLPGSGLEQAKSRDPTPVVPRWDNRIRKKQAKTSYLRVCFPEDSTPKRSSLGFDLEVPEDLLYHFVGIQPNEGVGREGMSGAIIGKYAGQDKHDSTEQRQTTAQQNNQDRNKCIQEGREGVFGVVGHGRAEEHALPSLFGLWSLDGVLSPCLVRPGLGQP